MARFAATVLTIATLAGAPASAQVTFDHFDQHVRTFVNNNPHADASSAVQPDMATTLAVADSFVSPISGTNNQASATITSIFTDPAHVGLSFSDIGDASLTTNADFQYASARSDFRYDFTVQTPFTINFSSRIVANGKFNPTYIELFDAADQSIAANDLLFQGNGSLGTFAAGKYDIRFFNQPNAGPDYLDLTPLTYATGSVNLTILAADAVPEPESWALMIGGFGLVGGAMRRRRGAPALA